MNKFIGIGRLTADPEIRATQDGKKIARYTLAIDRNKDAADFLRCVAFEGRADFAERYLHKGTKIAIEGRIQTGSYKDRDGKTVYTTEVYVGSHEFCESRQNAPESTQTGGNASGHTDTPSSVGDGFMDATDDLPFN